MQGHPPQGCGAGDLRQYETQTASGLSPAARSSRTMARIAGVDLPRQKHINIALTYIYGIGHPRAGSILDEAKVDPMKKVQDLSEEEVNRIRTVIEAQGMVEGDLRKEVSMNIKRLIEIGSYRGFRHRRNLPVRGQRTHPNARPRKGPRKGTVSTKKKATSKT